MPHQGSRHGTPQRLPHQTFKSPSSPRGSRAPFHHSSTPKQPFSAPGDAIHKAQGQAASSATPTMRSLDTVPQSVIEQRAQTARAKLQAMNPTIVSQSAPTKLISFDTTGIDMTQRPPVFDPMGLCAPKPSRNHTARVPELSSLFGQYGRDYDDEEEDYPPSIPSPFKFKRDEDDEGEEEDHPRCIPSPFKFKREEDDELDTAYDEYVRDRLDRRKEKEQLEKDDESEEYEPKLDLEDKLQHEQEKEDNRVQEFGTMRARSPSYDYHSISTTTFDPSKTYSERDPFVENPNRAPRSNPTPRPRKASPMKGVRSIATAPDGTEYSVYDEDFGSVGPDDTVDNHIAFVGLESKKVCDEAVRMAKDRGDRMAGQLVVQRLRLTVEQQVKEAIKTINALPLPPRE